MRWTRTSWKPAFRVPTVMRVNDNHARVCPSAEWAAHLRDDVLPAVIDGVDLGREMLEVGPGPGASTDWLRHRVERLVAVECDEDSAAALSATYAGSNVEVVTGDGADLRFDDESFDAVGCFTMLHHVPTAALQDAILGEALRVLRPGGVLVGSDSLPSDDLERFHAGDTYNPIVPGAFDGRLRQIGFERIAVHDDGTLRFRAYKPTVGSAR